MAKYLHDTLGLTLEDMRVNRLGRDDYFGRDVCNATHAFLTGKALKEFYRERFNYEEGGNVYIAGQTGRGMTTRLVKREFTWIREALGGDIPVRYLASHFYPEITDKVMGAVGPGDTRRKLK